MKDAMVGVTKAGQADIRRLLIIGTMARKPKMLVGIALANKMARKIWAMLTKNEDYWGSHAGDCGMRIMAQPASVGVKGSVRRRPDGRNDRNDLNRENQYRSAGLELFYEIWTRSADHHTSPRLLEMPHNEA